MLCFSFDPHPARQDESSRRLCAEFEITAFRKQIYDQQEDTQTSDTKI